MAPRGKANIVSIVRKRKRGKFGNRPFAFGSKLREIHSVTIIKPTKESHEKSDHRAG